LLEMTKKILVFILPILFIGFNFNMYAKQNKALAQNK